ncbi:type II toxin-antitoxin system RelB family antitoxin [Phragmitibacter flavus]|uniref:type II toxin-antitoxin system RelB family antitoxin n=1 Tax=Phragmitibacter flavus TaxID=2576071 RepID=UPI003CCE3B1A
MQSIPPSSGVVEVFFHSPASSILERLARKTGRTKTFHAREAILEHLVDLEDIYLVSQRLKRPAKTYSAEEVEPGLGLWVRRTGIKGTPKARQTGPTRHHHLPRQADFQ